MWIMLYRSWKIVAFWLPVKLSKKQWAISKLPLAFFQSFPRSFLCKRAPCWRWFEKYQTQPSGRIGIMVEIIWQSIPFHLGNFLTICLSQAGGKSALLWKKLGKPPHTWNIFNIILFIIIIMLVCCLICMHL